MSTDFWLLPLKITRQLLAAGMASTLFSIATHAYSMQASGTFDAVRHRFMPSDTLILDRHGEVLHRLRTDFTVRRGQWVGLADVSPALRTALIFSEDKRFYEHSGVDWQAASSAAWANLWNNRTRGASTLTMQLAGLLDSDLRRGPGGRSVVQKLGQTWSAQSLERHWRKDQILEAYLNLVPLRGELVGIDALSQTLFGKAPHGLDQREAAVTAALVRAPNATVAQVVQRACGILKSQTTGAAPDCEALDLFTTAALQRRDYAASAGFAPHVAQQLVSARSAARAAPAHGASASTQPAGSPVIRTTLRAPVQRFAVQTLQQHLRELAGRHVEDGALLVLDNASGEVLAWVGSSGSLSAAAEVDGVTALRQPGSTLKPFLYGQALAEKRITAASLLDDSGAQLQTASGLYIPQNYDHQFRGWVSARTALASSFNVPAVRLLAMVSPDAFHRQLTDLGLPLKESGGFYGYSLALGSAEVSLLHLTNAYRALANGGRTSPTRLTASPPISRSKPVQVLDPRAAFIVGDILGDTNARAPTFGLDSVLATRYWTAVKTGTSKDMRDNWAVGWSQHYTVGVWVGNASGAPMRDVSGTTGAAPIWATVMNHLHRTQASRAPTAPGGLVKAAVRFSATAPAKYPVGEQEAERQEWFLSGTQQPKFAIKTEDTRAIDTMARAQKYLKNSFQSPQQSQGRITAPTNGTLIAVDPDIPPNRQRVRFTAEGTKLRWLMNGKPLARGSTAQWLPWPGRHVVQLTNEQGEVLDEIRLEVRGAGVKPKAAQ